ncbi:hypothetical protein [Myroides fluvii]|uniref:hypothetical protein n=1 Tax=Myroides fluvii TaxID=2572594 RepID=UPI00131E388C|nr:hypothetical protein [Myroides fluvii]
MGKQQNKKPQDNIKAMKKDDFVKKIPKIDILSWKEAYTIIHAFCYSDTKINLNEIKQMLSLKDKDLVDLFLSTYILFDDNDKAYLELFINENLDHEDTAFISDLLYFATDWSLNINYLKVLNIIEKQAKDENYVVLGAINYIANTIKYYYIEEIVRSFNRVVNTKDYFQSEQILASISLYRITAKESYLDFIAELIDHDKDNLVFLTNVLREKSYQEAYFDLSEIKVRFLNKYHV